MIDLKYKLIVLLYCLFIPVLSIAAGKSVCSDVFAHSSPTSVREARDFVVKQSQRLDPQSRYVAELLDMIDSARSVSELKGFLLDSRGAYWAGKDIFARMPLTEQLQTNLITTETWSGRFTERETRFLQQTLIRSKDENDFRVLSLPASNGSELQTVENLRIALQLPRFSMLGLEYQLSMVLEAQKLLPDGHIEFRQFDAFSGMVPGQFNLIICRNFLGYFRPKASGQVVEKLISHLRNGGILFVDDFIIAKHPEIFQLPQIQKVPGIAAYRLR